MSCSLLALYEIALFFAAIQAECEYIVNIYKVADHLDRGVPLPVHLGPGAPWRRGRQKVREQILVTFKKHLLDLSRSIPRRFGVDFLYLLEISHIVILDRFFPTSGT